MAIREAKKPLDWQSKTILLLVVPWTAGYDLLQAHWWWGQVPVVAYVTLGISAIFGLIVWRLRAGTLGAAATGAAITASLMFSTTSYPYQYSWLHGGLMPVLAVFLLAFAATKVGRAKKERLGTAEARRGRSASQVAANLGVAALIAPFGGFCSWQGLRQPCFFSIFAFAALAEAAADTVSSEIGQVFGGQPRMLTTLRKVEPGTDGGVTLIGTAAGVLAAMIVAGIGSWAIVGGWIEFAIIFSGATFGLLFDSLLGATLERKGWLNNDAVNFLSTLSAPVAMLAGSWLILFLPGSR
jgi:uncharacterized protein (TIGR00297 family)